MDFTGLVLKCEEHSCLSCLLSKHSRHEWKQKFVVMVWCECAVIFADHLCFSAEMHTDLRFSFYAKHLSWDSPDFCKLEPVIVSI